MDVRVLGPLEVVGDDGAQVDIGGRNPRAFVALLALRVGEVAGTDQIIEQIWGDHDMQDPANALQALVSKLRRSLTVGRAEGAPSPIATKGNGYVLDLDAEAVDAVRFERLVGIGRARADVGDAAGASARLCARRSRCGGARRWPTSSSTSFAHGDRARLEDLRIAAIEQRIDADLALGHHEVLASELEALIADHPLRERFRAQLMLALYRSGRQAEALRALPGRARGPGRGARASIRPRSCSAWRRRSSPRPTISTRPRPPRRSSAPQVPSARRQPARHRQLLRRTGGRARAAWRIWWAATDW